MTPEIWAEMQEGILYAFGPLLFWWLVLIGVAGILSAIGVVMLEIVGHMTR